MAIPRRRDEFARTRPEQDTNNRKGGFDLMGDHAEHLGINTEIKYFRTEDDGLDRRRAREIPPGESLRVENDEAVAAQLRQLGIDIAGISVLPRNFKTAVSPDDFVFEQMTSTIQTLGRQVGLAIDIPGPSSYRSLHEKDFEIIAPVIVFAHAFLIEGGATLTVTFLEHFARHIATRWGPKAARDRDAVLEIVVTRGEDAKRITYRGPVDGLPRVVDAARAAFGENE
jgi:hypothetical protein